MRCIALVILSLMIATPVSAQYAYLRPKGAVPILDGCNQMEGYPDCHPDRPYMYQGRSVAIPMRPGPNAVYPPLMPYYPAYRW